MAISLLNEVVPFWEKVSFSWQVVSVFINGVLMLLSKGLLAALIRIPGIL